MTLQIFSMPENSRDWPNWLEGQLCRDNLQILVAELRQIVASDSQPSRKLEDICGEDLPEACSVGLRALSPEQIRQLLSQPELLPALQEHLILHGGDYWEQRLADGMGTVDVSAQWDNIRGKLDDQSVTVSEPEGIGWRKSVAYCAALAAIVLIAVTIWQLRGPVPGWGFHRSNLLTAQIEADEYLNSLADAARDWFNKRPMNTSELAERLGQFSRGCDTLIAAPHPQLEPNDRDWLVERCGLWKSKIDGLRTRLQGGETTFDDGLSESDEIIGTLQKALRTRASQVG